MLTTSLESRVRNTTLPKIHAHLPLLEAIVNGIQAIDALSVTTLATVDLHVRIQRDPQDALDFSTAGPGRAPLRPSTGSVSRTKAWQRSLA